MDNLKIFIKKYGLSLKSITFNLFLLWSLIIFYDQLHFIFYLFIIAAITNIVISKDYKVSVWRRDNVPLFFLLAFTLWNIISLIYTDDLYEGLKRTEKMIPLLLISLTGIFINKKHYDQNKIINTYLYGTLFAIIVTILYVCYQFFTGHIQAVGLVRGFSEINFLLFFEHRLYIGILILMSVPIIFKKIFFYKNQRLLFFLIIWILILLVLFYVVFSSGSRILVFIFLVLLGTLSFFELKNKVGKKLFYTLGFLMLLISISLIYLHPRSNLTLHLLQNKKELYKIDSRIRTWDSSLELWSEDIFMGQGLGDAEHELLQKYKKNDYRLEYEQNYNAHNQFFETGIQSGLIGVILLCATIFSLFYLKKRNYYIICFVIVLFFSFLIESALNRNLGTFSLAYWIFVLSACSNNNRILETVKNKTLKIYVPLVFVIISIIALLSLNVLSQKSLFNSKNPHTYLTVPFKLIDYIDLPHKDQLPQKTYAALLDDKTIFKKFEYGFFVAPEIFSGKLDYADCLNFGIWCYVSENSNIRRLYLYGWNKIHTEYKLSYDFTNKGSWQYIQLQNMEFSTDYAVGVRIDLFRETNDLKGNVFLALPYISRCEEENDEF